MSRRRRWPLVMLVLLGGALLIAVWPHDAGRPVEVATRDGVVVGRESDQVRRFLGLPYAQPPVGALRWQAPQPLRAPWQEPRDAAQFASACVQGAKPSLARGSSEDCLYLNVWAPVKAGPHPVMVWIHGGGLMIGSANEPPYDGAALAASQDVIVVTLNYRLSYLGYLSLEGLDASPDAMRGNQGFLDQIAALRWVQDNIAAFGGDPGSVTLFGESGGAVSTCLLLASPLTQGLIHKAILQSGVCGIQPVLDAAQAREQTQGFLKKIACADAADPLACARALSPAEIEQRGLKRANILAEDSRSFSFYPLAIDDGHFVQGSPLQSLVSGPGRALPVLLGTTKDEGSLFTGRIRFPSSAAAYRDDLETRFPGAGAELASLYPYERHQPIGNAYAKMFADAMEVCPTRRVAELRVAQSAPVFLYRFTQQPSAPALGLMSLSFERGAAPLGVFHGAEIPYVFGSNTIVGHVWKTGQKQTRATLMRYWGNFARTGSPNGADVPAWPAYDAAARQYLEIDSTPQTRADLGRDTCDFWDRHPTLSFW